MTINCLGWKIGGEAGSGIKVTGEMWARMCHHLGLNVYGYTEYPSLIRGGHNTYHIFAAERAVRSIPEQVNILVALNRETIDLHIKELSPGAVVVYDNEVEQIDVSVYKARYVSFLSVPLKRLAMESAQSDIMKNTVALGASARLVKLPFEYVKKSLSAMFGRKGEQIVSMNEKAAFAGYQYVGAHWDTEYAYTLTPREKKNTLLLSGNEAIGLGALASGINYYAAYPMTPSSSLLEFLAQYGPQYHVVVRQTEDEIAAINTAIGASLGGIRAMTGSSGGGFSLMVEALGMAGIMETPLVILEAQRPGPSTGLPTWGGQDDLRFVLHASQGEFPRIVLAPGDPEECYTETVNAFNLADKYQCPVIILSDKFLAESLTMSPMVDTKNIEIDRGLLATDDMLKSEQRFGRYTVTEEGVSPRSLPGQEGGIYLANSDEHDEYGYSREESEIRNQQNMKRLRKMDEILKEIPVPHIYGPASADVTLLCWGSVKGPVLDAMPLLLQAGVKVNVMHFIYLWPFPSEYVEKFLRSCKRTIMIENNVTAQAAGLVREMTGVAVNHVIGKSDGRPFTPEEVRREVLRSMSYGIND